MNLPSHFKSCGLQFVIIKLNFSTSFRYVNSSYVCTILSKKVFLSIKFILQFNKKCSSSSMTSHIRHFLSATGVLGLVCRPLSIARVCELFDLLNSQQIDMHRGHALVNYWQTLMWKYPSYIKIYTEHRLCTSWMNNSDNIFFCIISNVTKYVTYVSLNSLRPSDAYMPQ